MTRNGIKIQKVLRAVIEHLIAESTLHRRLAAKAQFNSPGFLINHSFALYRYASVQKFVVHFLLAGIRVSGEIGVWQKSTLLKKLNVLIAYGRSICFRKIIQSVRIAVRMRRNQKKIGDNDFG